MLKLIGAVLIVASSTLSGFYVAHTYQERPKQLRILQQSLQMLETEIVYASIPLYLAMNHIGERIPSVIKQFFITMSINLQELDGASSFECWDKSLQKHFYKTSLKRQDKEILLQFGQTLGISDKEDQIKHIRLTMQSLSTEEALAREEERVYTKLSKNLGVLLGLLIVILIY